MNKYQKKFHQYVKLDIVGCKSYELFSDAYCYHKRACRKCLSLHPTIKEINIRIKEIRDLSND